MKNLALKERKSQRQHEKESSRQNKNFARRKSMENSRSEFYWIFEEKRNQKQQGRESFKLHRL